MYKQNYKTIFSYYDCELYCDQVLVSEGAVVVFL